jgi:hypothetical protein
MHMPGSRRWRYAETWDGALCWQRPWRRCVGKGHTECELENLLMDFKGIQVTLAVMARAVINGRVDCKTAAAGAFADDVKAVVDAPQEQNLTADKR